MKKITLILIALGFCLYAYAESKTEVVVKKGIVKTTNSQGDSLVRPGQKAILEDGKQPTVSFNNKIVEKLLQMHRQIQAERNSGDEKILHTSAQVYSIDQEDAWKMGAIITQTNTSDKATNVCRIGPSDVLNEIQAYTVEGKSIQYKMEKIDDRHAYYYAYFDEDVQPGEDFKFLAIMNLSKGMEGYDRIKKEMLTKQDGQWRIRNNNDTPYCLNYMHYILPETAIFVKSDPSPQTIEQQDGRVSVTLRRYVDGEGSGPFHVCFLWPEKDGTCLGGIPWTNAGSEAVKIYELFLQEDIQSPALWGELAIKLVGGGFYDAAYDAFERCYNGHDSAVWDYCALTWMGHLDDLWGQREDAVKKYRQALTIKPAGRDMRHDQWGIVLTHEWINQRLETPFTESMITVSESKKQLEKTAWKDAGQEILALYQDAVQNKPDAADNWCILGIKLVGSGYFDEAMDCFARGEQANPSNLWAFTAITWQGHLYDLSGERQKAVEKYNQALTVDYNGTMRHDQWGIVLNKDWLRQRLETPFTREMLK